MDEILQKIVNELREYQTELMDNNKLNNDGWQNTFYDGVEYAIDVVVDYMKD